MNWIKIEVGLLEKPKVIALCEITGLDEYAVVGRLVKLWAWVDTHLENCNASSVTKAFLDRYLSHAGFADSLEKVGWIDASNGLRFMNIDEHNGSTAKARAQANKRVVRSRNGASVTKALPEKRREEKKNNPLTPKGEQVGNSANIPKSPQALQIAKLFSRNPETAWSDSEIKAFKRLTISIPDLQLIETYYRAERAKGKDGIHRRDLSTFLNNYMGELDRAKAFQPVASTKPYIPGVSK